jgi:hypothetical protein
VCQAVKTFGVNVANEYLGTVRYERPHNFPSNTGCAGCYYNALVHTSLLYYAFIVGRCLRQLSLTGMPSCRAVATSRFISSSNRMTRARLSPALRSRIAARVGAYQKNSRQLLNQA